MKLHDETYEAIVEYMADVAEQHPDIARQGLGAVLASALIKLSEAVHPQGDQAVKSVGKPRALTRAEALGLTQQWGSLRRASEFSGVSKSAIQRALVGVYQ